MWEVVFDECGARIIGDLEKYGADIKTEYEQLGARIGLLGSNDIQTLEEVKWHDGD